MICIVAGSRYPREDYARFQHDEITAVFYFIEHMREIKEIVSGNCEFSPDKWGEKWSKQYLGKEATLFPADWDKHGRSAGPIRNAQMAEYADMLLCFFDGKSRGTKNMIDQALKKGLDVHVYNIQQ